MGEGKFVPCLIQEKGVKLDPKFWIIIDGGERGIRTPEHLSALTVFKTAGFNHSPISPYSGDQWPVIYCNPKFQILSELLDDSLPNIAMSDWPRADVDTSKTYAILNFLRARKPECLLQSDSRFPIAKLSGSISEKGFFPPKHSLFNIVNEVPWRQKPARKNW